MYAKFFKRVIDFTLSLIALLILFPILLILVIIGAVAMRGNPFFTQLRPGKINKKTGEEKIFKLIKFRTMSNAKDRNGELLPDDVRLNKYGRMLRKTSLDELPELYIKYDASHAYNRNLDYLEQLNDWGERVAHVHIKGTVHAGKRDVDDPPAGMDDIQWSSLFAILYSRGYNGDLSIEPHSKTWQGELGNAGVLFTRNFIKGFMI